MKLKISLLLFLCPIFWASGQESASNIIRHALKIGDEVPDVAIHNILNYNTTETSLLRFRGKLLILDFWDTWCSNCIEVLPKLDSLQQEFRDSICILPVTKNDKESIQKFLTQNRYLHGLKLTTVTGDTALGKIFPHTMLPHDVWIDENGVVCAITDAEYINAANIRAVLQGKRPSWTVKSDSLTFDENKPVLAPVSRSGFYSALTPYLPGLPSVFGVRDDSLLHTVRTFVINFPILKMYMMAWERLLYFPPNRVFLEVKDSTRFTLDQRATYRADWNRMNSYCYESVLPATTPDSVRLATMRQDLDRYLCLHGRMEKRKLDCLVLSLGAADAKGLRSKGGKAVNTLNSGTGLKQLRNAKLSNILWQMNQQAGSRPVIDETHYTGTVDLILNVRSFTDIPAVQAALTPYGLRLKEEERDIDVFVVTQTN